MRVLKLYQKISPNIIFGIGKIHIIFKKKTKITENS